MAPIKNSDGAPKWKSKLWMVHYWMLQKIPTYTFISFQEIFPPILLFSPIFLLVFEEISHLYFYSDSSSIRNSRVLTFIKLYQMLPKNPTYTFINFQQKFPPIRLFPPILLLIFEEISHLYFYSDSSSIRNSRVGRSSHIWQYLIRVGR